jgi:hypothetical protein
MSGDWTCLYPAGRVVQADQPAAGVDVDRVPDKGLGERGDVTAQPGAGVRAGPA